MTVRVDPSLLEQMAGAQKYDAGYFRTRQGNDALRVETFRREKVMLERHLGSEVFLKGRVMDVGCSTGEFLSTIGWDLSKAYGMEIGEFARQRARAAGISFEKDLFGEKDFFDLVIFRGTIQYLPNPFEHLYAAYRALKPGGCLFLTGPNTNSPYYRLFHTLPFLEEEIHFWIPCDTSLRMVLRNCGFQKIEITYPYLDSPYARPLRDHAQFLAKLLFRTHHRFPFWRNVMYVFANK